jgi:poly-gamma-glutamate synthesis protein (capsule biosynthesis protein)
VGTSARRARLVKAGVASTSIALAVAIMFFSALAAANLLGPKAIPTAERVQAHSVYIQPDFPLYALYSGYFTHARGYTLTTSASADLVIARDPTGLFAQKRLIYDEVLVLTASFKHPSSTITSGKFERLLADPGHLAVDRALALYYPMLKTTADPLAFVQQDGSHYALLPFEKLTNRYRTVDIGGTSPIRKGFDERAYPLKAQYFLAARAPLDEDAARFISQHTYANYAPSEIHTIIMTGTSALGRGEYFHIFQHGTAYPAEYVAPIMKNADITHVSDEVSYVPGCVQQVGTNQFCALPDFIQTLQDAGVNLVELTGNHNNDFGAQYSTSSIQLYDQNHIKHFGGGLNAQDARKPALFTLGGTTFAFLGYNEPGPAYAFASATQAGAAQLDVAHMKEDIQAAKKVADVVFVDVQWENELDPVPSQSQVSISQQAIDAGADVVTGTSGHRPEGMAFYHGKTIFYGLGNLFFDQMENLATRQGVILRHTFYGKRLISSELIPTLLYDYCQPRPVTGADAQAILDQVFQSSPSVS